MFASLSGSPTGLLNFIYLKSYWEHFSFQGLDRSEKKRIVTYRLKVDVCRSHS